MRNYDLLDAVGGISPEYINKAMEEKEHKRGIRIRKWLSAACVCLLVGSVFAVNNFHKIDGSSDSGNDVDGTVSSDEDFVTSSIAVGPNDFDKETVENATLEDITFEQALADDEIGEYVPRKIVDGYSVDSTNLYETTLKDGTIYKMISVLFKNGEESEYSLWIMNFDPQNGQEVYSVDSIPSSISVGSTFYVKIEKIYIGFSYGDLSYDELQEILGSMATFEK